MMMMKPIVVKDKVLPCKQTVVLIRFQKELRKYMLFLTLVSKSCIVIKAQRRSFDHDNKA